MDEPKITTVEKVKNPKRVEQGKRLAAISREAKARKAAERAKINECVDNANMLYVVVGATAVIGLAYGAYSYFPEKEEENQPEVIENQPKKILLKRCSNK